MRILILLLFIGFFSCNPQSVDISTTDLGTALISGNEITAPPKSLGLDPFYKKYLAASGVPIISSEKVPDEALYQAGKIISQMVTKRDDVRRMFIKNKGRVGIISISEQTLDMPEYRDLQRVFPDTDWNSRGRAYGATMERPLSSCSEENLLCYTAKDGHSTEEILIHEFAHSFHSLGIRFVNPNFDNELQNIYEKAIKEGLWKNTYAGSNCNEYWAEGVQDWFNTNAESGSANGIHNYVNTRAELKAYDPRLYALISEYFPAVDENLSCHSVQNIHKSDNSIDEPELEVAINSDYYYRLETMFTGDKMAMSVDENNKYLLMKPISDNKTQYWTFTKRKDGYYRITNAALGSNFSLDIANNTSKTPQISNTGEYSGQLWKIVPEDNGWFRFRTVFTGQELSLDVSNSSQKEVVMSARGDYSGQYWKLVRVK